MGLGAAVARRIFQALDANHEPLSVKVGQGAKNRISLLQALHGVNSPLLSGHATVDGQVYTRFQPWALRFTIRTVKLERITLDKEMTLRSLELPNLRELVLSKCRGHANFLSLRPAGLIKFECSTRFNADSVLNAVTLPALEGFLRSFSGLQELRLRLPIVT